MRAMNARWGPKQHVIWASDTFPSICLSTNNVFSLIRIYTNDTHCCKQLLRGWIPTLSPNDDDNDDLVSSSSAPVLEGARNCGSSQIQELHTGAIAFNPFFVTILLMNKYYDFVSIKVSIS